MDSPYLCQIGITEGFSVLSKGRKGSCERAILMAVDGK